MRPPVCLFCRHDSSQSRSVEHVLPESLGNTTAVLPPGVVCDNCNNYFARKVEGPLLGSDPLRALRHFENVPNKRGRIPSLEVLTTFGVTGTFEAWQGGPIPRVITLPLQAAIEALRPGSQFEVFIPDRDRIPRDVVLGRFVCKVALEAMAARCLADPVAYDSLLKTDDLELCRLHARYGAGPTWPVRVNRIHAADRAWVDEQGGSVQRVWEHELLITPGGQVLFAVAIFGLELAINVLEPELTAYEEWLARSRSASLLYPDGLKEGS